MAINYTYDQVVNGVTDASADYMNHMQEGIKDACDGVDAMMKIALIHDDITVYANEKREYTFPVQSDMHIVAIIPVLGYNGNDIRHITMCRDFNVTGKVVLYNSGSSNVDVNVVCYVFYN